MDFKVFGLSTPDPWFSIAERAPEEWFRTGDKTPGYGKPPPSPASAAPGPRDPLRARSQFEWKPYRAPRERECHCRGPHWGRRPWNIPVIFMKAVMRSARSRSLRDGAQFGTVWATAKPSNSSNTAEARPHAYAMAAGVSCVRGRTRLGTSATRLVAQIAAPISCSQFGRRCVTALAVFLQGFESDGIRIALQLPGECGQISGAVLRCHCNSPASRRSRVLGRGAS